MASPLQTRKKSVNLAAAPGSRIRRDPPPVAQKIAEFDPEERDRRMAVIGVVSFALAIAIIMVGISMNYGWTPRQYTIEINEL